MIDDTGAEHQARAIALRVFAVISTKWALRVLEEVAAGHSRFRDLHRTVDGISHKMLTATLRELEEHGLISRHDHHTANPRVDYAATDAGRRLLDTVYGLCAWSRGHLDSLLDAPAHHRRSG